LTVSLRIFAAPPGNVRRRTDVVGRDGLAIVELDPRPEDELGAEAVPDMDHDSARLGAEPDPAMA